MWVYVHKQTAKDLGESILRQLDRSHSVSEVSDAGQTLVYLEKREK